MSGHSNPLTDWDKLGFVLAKLNTIFKNDPKTLDTEGLFRIAGNEKNIKETFSWLTNPIKKDISKTPPELSLYETCSLVKKIIGKISEQEILPPALQKETEKIFNLLKKTPTTKKEKEENEKTFNGSLSVILEQTPALKTLFEILTNISAHSEKNKMAPMNLSVTPGKKLIYLLCGKKTSEITEKDELSLLPRLQDLLTNFLQQQPEAYHPPTTAHKR